MAVVVASPNGAPLADGLAMAAIGTTRRAT